MQDPPSNAFIEVRKERVVSCTAPAPFADLGGCQAGAVVVQCTAIMLITCTTGQNRMLCICLTGH